MSDICIISSTKNCRL